MTPYLVKGAIINSFPDHPIIPYINGDMRGQIHYPRIQVKVLRQQLCLFGIAHGEQVVRDFAESFKSLEVEGIAYHASGHETVDSEFHFDVDPDNFTRYKFITPWVALNRKMLGHFTALLPRERIAYLNRQLVQNILFLAREFGLEVQHNVSARVKLQSLSPRVVEEQGSGSFKGYFTANVQLPDYLGLGNGITKGLGTLVAL